MRACSLFILALALAAGGCPSQKSGGPAEDTTKAPSPEDSGTGSEDSSAEPAAETGDDDKMPDSPLQRARAEFREALAQEFDHPADEIPVTPESEEVFNEYGKYDVGELRALESRFDDLTVRGFADGSGTVVFDKRENYGPLLEAAQLLDESASLPAAEVAERIAWMKPEHSLVKTEADYAGKLGKVPDSVGPPEIARKPDGGAVLRFVTIEAGDTGARVPWKFEVKVTPGYDAEVEVRQLR